MSLILLRTAQWPRLLPDGPSGGHLLRDRVPAEFRAVEHRPELPARGRRPTTSDQDALSSRFTDLRGLLLRDEERTWAMPPLIPRIEAAVSAYSEAYGSPVEADVGAFFVRAGVREGSAETLGALDTYVEYLSGDERRMLQAVCRDPRPDEEKLSVRHRRAGW